MSSSTLGKNSKSTNTISSNEPPDWAKSIFTKTADEILKLYNNGKGGNVYNGKRIADLSDNTKNSINGLYDTANKFNDNSFNNLAKQQSASENNLGDLASGKLLGNNTAFKQALNNNLNEAATSINRQMSGAGRYGSGANNVILANTLGNIAQKANAQQYNQNVNNMIRANSQIDESRANQLSNLTKFLNSRRDAYTKSLDGSLILDKNQQDKLDAKKANWEEKDNSGWNRLKKLEDFLNGNVGRYGTTNSKSTSNSNSNNFLGNIGGALGKLISK